MNTRDALVACLPPQAYDRSAPGVQAEAAAAAAALDGAMELAEVVLTEQQPDLTLQALSDWERNYGLPDSCIGGLAATEAARRMNLLGRFAARGNLSRSFILDQATRLGYPGCTIDELSPGSWRLNVPMSTAVVEMTCASPCDSALRHWGNTQLECIINRLKPAHSTALFAYAP